MNEKEKEIETKSDKNDKKINRSKQTSRSSESKSEQPGKEKKGNTRKKKNEKSGINRKKESNLSKTKRKNSRVSSGKNKSKRTLSIDKDILQTIREKLEIPSEKEIEPEEIQPNQEIINHINMQLEETLDKSFDSSKEFQVVDSEPIPKQENKQPIIPVPVQESFMADVLENKLEKDASDNIVQSEPEELNDTSIDRLKDDIDAIDDVEEKISDNLDSSKEVINSNESDKITEDTSNNEIFSDQEDISNGTDNNLLENTNQIELLDIADDTLLQEDSANDKIDESEEDVEKSIEEINELEEVEDEKENSGDVLEESLDDENDLEEIEEIEEIENNNLEEDNIVHRLFANIVDNYVETEELDEKLEDGDSESYLLNSKNFPLRVFFTMICTVLVVILIIIIPPIINFSHILFSNVQLTNKGDLPLYLSQSGSNIVNSSDGLPSQTDESTIESQVSEQPTIQTGKWLYASPEDLSSTESIESFANKAKTAGASTVVLTIKDEKGNIYINSENETASKSVASNTYDTENIIKAFNEKDIQLVASLSAFKDQLTPKVNRDIAIQLAGKNRYLWYNGPVNGGGTPWLNPYSQGAQDYISSLLEECMNLGFTNILIEGLQFPDGYGLDQANLGENSSAISQADILKEIGLNWQQQLKERQVSCWFEYPMNVLSGENLNITQQNPLSFQFDNYMVQVPDSILFSQGSSAIKLIFQTGTENNVQKLGIDLHNTSISIQEKNDWESGSKEIGYQDIIA